jgi:CHC2 zinc finger
MAEAKPKDWVDFAAAKAVRFEVVLEALGLLGSLHRDGEQLQGICPLHKASGEKKDSFGVHLGKQTFNCFACKKHGKVMDFVMQVKDTGAKEAAAWLVSLGDNKEVQESVPRAVEGNGSAGEAKPASSAVHAVEGLTAREVWRSRVIARGVAWYLAETFKPLSSDIEVIENCIVAKVAMVVGMAKEGT